MKEYNADSVKQLSFREGVRKRVGMYLGSPDMEGVYNALFEIVSNSVDEAIVGFGKKIIISTTNISATVQDFGRGIPRGPKEGNPEVLITLLTESHSGAKFDDDSYTSVRGLNGIGSGATCCSSDHFRVISKRDGYEWTLDFIKGVPQTATATRGPVTKETGTTITFAPSAEVFSAEPINIDYEIVVKKVKDMSYLLPGITFVVINLDTKVKQEFCSKNGILDLLEDVVKEPLVKMNIHSFVEDKENRVEIAFKWSKKGHSEKSYIFVNGAECPEGGSPMTGFKTAITRTLNKDFNKTFSGELVRRGLTYVIACSVKHPLFANQTKTKITNAELRGLSDKAFTDAWRDFSLKNPKELEIIKDFLAKEDKADQAAERARNAIINSVKEIETAQKKKVILADKLKDCEKHGEEAMLVICEGDSALGALSQARPIENVALLPIRGKIINVLRHDIEKVLENEEVKNILMCLNAGMHEKYDHRKLRYGKIGIAVDADADGYNIMCLITTLVYGLFPKFLEEGRLCWLRSPLYKVEYRVENSYAFNDSELESIQKQKGRGKIKRFKGLGEMNPDDTEVSMFGKHQRLERLILNDKEQTYSQIEMLMGPEVEGRKQFIFDNIDFSLLEE